MSAEAADELLLRLRRFQDLVAQDEHPRTRFIVPNVGAFVPPYDG